MITDLNQRAATLVRELIAHCHELRISAKPAECGTVVIDCGVHKPGGLEAGRRLAEICMAGLADIQLGTDTFRGGTGLGVRVRTDRPLEACLLSQYAGWQISGERFFAMGSGPMRAVAAKEKLFSHFGPQKATEAAVGVLETAQLPPSEVCESLAADCGLSPEQLTLLVAPTASQAGTFQVVARSVETCLHKLHELGFDLTTIESGMGTAPLPPVAPDDLTGIGWTNDAVLYGGKVVLWVRGDDDHLAEICRQVPSNASADFGQPFHSIFERYERDFYKIDPLLFSPAEVTLVNLATGRTHRFGELRHDVLEQSFGGV